MSKRRNKRRRKRTHSGKQTNIPDPKQLLESGCFAEAVQCLESEIAEDPTDVRRRLMAQAFAGMKDYAKALEQIAFVDIQEPTDILYRGWLLYCTEEIEDAREAIEDYLVMHPDCPDGYYWLGRTHDHWNSRAENAKQLAIDNFRNAIACEGCRADAYVLLARSLPFDDAGRNESLNVLRAGLAAHCDSVQIRFNLSDLYLRPLEQWSDAMDVLGPLLESVEPDASALWRAYRACIGLERFSEARDFFAAIPSEKLEGALRQQVLGSIELLAGNFNAAFKTLSDGIEDASVQYRAFLDFGRAESLLGMNEPVKAVHMASDAAFALLSLVHEDFFFDEPVMLDGELQIFEASRSLRTVCTLLLNDERKSVKKAMTDELRGALTFLLYKETRSGDSDSDCENLLLSAATMLDHPVMSFDLEYYHFYNKNYSAGIANHIRYCRWMLQLGETPKDVFTYHATVYIDDNAFPTTKKSCKAMLKTFITELDTADANEITSIFIPTYSFVRDCLRGKKMFAELAEPAMKLLEHAPYDVNLLWDRAYAEHCRENSKEAEDGYRALLAISPDQASSLHNLSLLINDRGEIEEALSLSEKAASLSPGQDSITNWHGELRQRRAEEEREERSRENFLLTAVQRWPKLDYYKRQLLCTLSLISGWSDMEDLSKLSGIDEKYLSGHLRVLEEEGMILYPKTNTFEVNPHVLPLVERENSHAVVTKIIHSDESIAFKPIFNSKQEYTVYNILIGLFPNHLVFPNMALQTVFQYRRMRDLLEYDEFSFFLKSQVDFCLTSTSNYLPLIAFEVDSRFHDQEDQKARDDKKNKIFTVGGVPLVRLRSHGRPTAAAMHGQIVEAVTSLGCEIREMSKKTAVLSTLEREIDFESFGDAAEDWDDGRWVTVSQAASVSGANAGVITRAVDAGDLKGNGKTGRERRIDAVDLTRWMLCKASHREPEESIAQVERLVKKHIGD